MKFKVTTSGNFYTKENAEKLKALGFTFEDCSPIGKRDQYMTGPSEGAEVEIGSLDELLAFSAKWGELIISAGSIEIYDDYRE